MPDDDVVIGQAEPLQALTCAANDFGGGPGARRAEQLNANLMKLTVAAPLRFLIAESWSDVVEPKRQRMILQMVHKRAAYRSGEFRAQAQMPVFEWK